MNEIPEINITLTTMPIVSHPHKLKGNWKVKWYKNGSHEITQEPEPEEQFFEDPIKSLMRRIGYDC